MNTKTQSVCPPLSVVGLGKLGAPIAAALASRGFKVVGVDTDPDRVEAIQQLRAPVHEAGLNALLKQTRGRLSATTDLAAAVDATNVTFVIVPTPSDENGRFSLKYVLGACETIGRAVKCKPDDHLVVITSTVMPGDTEGPIRDALENHSGKQIGEGLGLCYSPEFVALGSVVRDFLNPEMILIGQSDPWAGDMLAAIALRTAMTRPQVVRLNFMNAELAKLAVNTFVTTKITFANMLTAICQHLPGADVDAVTGAIGLDSRIGRKYLRGGLGYGGPCFPRDNKALTHLAQHLDTRAELAEAVDIINHQSIDRLIRLVGSQLDPSQVVGVLGLAYKPGTDVVDESQGLLLAQELARQEVRVVAYDPLAMSNAQAFLPGSIELGSTLEETIAAADVLIVATDWPQFSKLDPATLARPGGPRRLVIDCWRCLDPMQIEPVADYIALGRGPGMRSQRNATVTIRNPVMPIAADRSSGHAPGHELQSYPRSTVRSAYLQPGFSGSCEHEGRERRSSSASVGQKAKTGTS